jgi:hypothetical protein
MSGGANAQQQALAAQNAQAQQNYNTIVANAEKPTPLEQRTSDDAMSWLDFTSGKNGPVDYTKAPGLVNLGLYDEATANRFAERTATGGIEMGKDGGNATALAMRKTQLADQMGEARGANLANAVRAKDAEVRGSTVPFLIGTDAARNANLVGSATSRANSAEGDYGSYKPPTPFWQTAVVAGLGAAGNVFQGAKS